MSFANMASRKEAESSKQAAKIDQLLAKTALLASRQQTRVDTTLVPRLGGDSENTNHHHWRLEIMSRLRRATLLQYALTAVAPPEGEIEHLSWAQNRASCYLAIRETTQPVHKTLELGGYVPDGDPHALWKAIGRIIGAIHAPEAADFLTRIGNLNRAEYASMYELLGDFFHLRERLETFTELDDAVCALWLLNSIRHTHGVWYTKHMHIFAKSKPRFSAVLEDINSIAMSEKVKNEVLGT